MILLIGVSHGIGISPNYGYVNTESKDHEVPKGAYV